MKAKNFIILIIILLLSALSCSRDNDDNNQDSAALNVHSIEFKNIETNEPDPLRTLKSLKKAGELFMITYYGDYNSLLDELNEKIINEGIESVVPGNRINSECSIFTAFHDPDHPILGRNMDQNIERGVLAGLYSPPDGYKSICISKMSSMGFDRGEDPTLLPVENRQSLLNSAFFLADGMNECGISIALASQEHTVINRDENKKLIFITYLLREVLDHAQNLEEAVEIVKKYDVFDVNTSIISNHLLISGPDGNSVIAEYSEGKWRFMYNDRPWQIVTNGTFLYNVSESERRNNCPRYRAIDDYMEDVDGGISWQDGMNVLKSVSVSGDVNTQWSTLYDMKTKEIYISLYRDYNDIFLLKIR